MLFNSFSYFVFFPVMSALFFATPHRLQWLTLLIGSCFFYMAFRPIYIVVLATLILVDYAAAIIIENSQDAHFRKTILIFSILANVAFLCSFKYAHALLPQLSLLSNVLSVGGRPPLSDWALPIGLSFHTFQSMSYTIEVYRRSQKAERHLGIYALYVMFFPQLVAGPIERPKLLLPQLRQEHNFNADEFVNGLRRILWGLFKKTVIADNLATYVVAAPFANPTLTSPLALALGAVGFSLQIYCDFSGYCDIALGSARALGFKLSDNFNTPYISSSIAEFWKRWHISLSTWFRDYVYLPLGGNRLGSSRTAVNILVVFLLSGMWHGGSVNFAIWGVLHGGYYLLHHHTKAFSNHIANRLGFALTSPWLDSFRVLVTFTAVTLAWIFFRSPTIEVALQYLCGLLNPRLWGTAATIQLFAALAVGFALLFLYKRHFVESARHKTMDHLPPGIRWALYISATWAILNLGPFEETPFIYFQF